MAEQPVMSWLDFQRTLDTFKTNFVKYRVSNNPANKTAYETAQRSIDASLTSLRTNVDANEGYMDSFKGEVWTNLENLHKKSQAIQQKGPEIQDIYLAEKKRSEKVETTSYTPLIIKAVMLAALMGVASLVPSMLAPPSI